MTKQSKNKIDGASIKKFYVRQFTSLFWMLLAVAVGLTIREMLPALKANIEISTMALVSGLIGIVIPNVAQFGRAGKVMTKGNNRRVNLLVGAGITLLLLLIFNWLVASAVN